MNSDRCRGGQPLEDAEQQLEQPALGRIDAQTGRGSLRRGTEIRHQPGQLGAALPEDGLELLRVGAPDEPAQGLDDRRVRQRALAEIDAAAERTTVRPRPRRARRTRPPASSCRRRPRRRPGSRCSGPRGRAAGPARSRSELVRTADEDGARDADRHAARLSGLVTGPSHAPVRRGARPLRSHRRGDARQPADDGERPTWPATAGRASVPACTAGAAAWSASSRASRLRSPRRPPSRSCLISTCPSGPLLACSAGVQLRANGQVRTSGWLVIRGGRRTLISADRCRPGRGPGMIEVARL